MGQSDLVITGVGMTLAIGQGKEAFLSALLSGKSAFGIMQREGRQKDSAFIGAENRYGGELRGSGRYTHADHGKLRRSDINDFFCISKKYR